LRASASFLGPHPARRSRSALDHPGRAVLALRSGRVPRSSALTLLVAPGPRSTIPVALSSRPAAADCAVPRPAPCTSLQVSARPSRSRCPRAPLRASASFLGPHPARRSRSALDLTGDEGLELRAALRVLHLDRRGLHEVRRGREDRAADAAVLRDL